MRRQLLALAALSTAFATAPAHGAEPRVLKPDGAWNVNYGEDSCRMQRLFGTGEDKHALMIEQHWPSDRVLLTLAGPAFGKFRSMERTELRLFEEQEPIRGAPFAGSFGAVGKALIYASLRLENGPEEPKAESEKVPEPVGFTNMDLALGKRARFVEVRQAGRAVRLETGPLDAAFTVLNDCTTDLLRSLGLDAERHVTMRSEPRWLNSPALIRRILDAYPSAAQVQGEQGTMRMRVIVGEDGTVESCSIVKATATRYLESPACDVMRRAKFEPARDVEGKPFRALFATSITYMIP